MSTVFNKKRCIAEWKRARHIIVEHELKIICVLATVGVVFLSTQMLQSRSACDEKAKDETVRDPILSVPDTCPWQMVMSDVSHRLRLLEMAFKEQAKARELLTLQVYNQTVTTEAQQRKMEMFCISLQKISDRIDRTNENLEQLSSRLYSDECLGFLILLCLAVQIILVLRAKFVQLRISNDVVSRPSSLTVSQTCPARDLANTTRCNSDSSATNAKKSNSKMESCFVLFNHFKPSQQQIAPLVAACSKNSEETKLSLKSAYTIDCEESLQRCPSARFYLIVVNSQFGNYGRRHRNDDGQETKTSFTFTSSRISPHQPGNTKQQQHQQHQRQQQQMQSSPEVDLLNSFINNSKTNGAQILMAIVNDDSSMKLSSNSLYSPTQPLIRGNELLLELAFNGRVCTVCHEFSLFQLNHVKKIYRSILNPK